MFANHNWLQEVQVIGLGANAEYGGFTGVASNSLFRSGSNRFRGLFETLYENDALTGINTTDEILEANPDSDRRRRRTTSPTRRPDRRTDQARQALVLHELPVLPAEDGARRAIPPTTPAGIPDPTSGPTPGSRSSPRFLFKPTLKLGDSDQLTGFFQAERLRHRRARSRRQRSRLKRRCTKTRPEFAWNANYTKVLSSSSVFDVRYAGFWGYYYLTPVQRRRHAGLVRRRRGLLRRQLVLLLQGRSRPPPGQRQPDQVRVRIRRRAQPEVRRRVRAQLRQEPGTGTRRHVRLRAASASAVLRVSVGRLPEGQHQQPLSPLSRRTRGRSARG